jgi:hypothetical protein
MPFSMMQILCGLVAPAALLVVIAAIAWRLSADARWVFGPLMAIGFGLAYWNFEPKPGWPPTGNVIHLHFYLPIVLGILTLADSLFKPPLWLRTLVVVVFWRMAVRLFLQPQVPGTFSASSAEMWIDVCTVVAVVWWIAFEKMAELWPGVTVPVILAMLSAGCAVLLAMGWHIQTSGAVAGAVMSMSCAGIVLGAVSGRVSFSRGFAQMAVLILQLLLAHGYFYTEDTLTNQQELLLGLVLVSPLLAFVGEIPAVRRQQRIWQIGARLAPVLILLGIVCGITARQYAQWDQTTGQQEE